MGVLYDVTHDRKNLKAEVPEIAGVYTVSNNLAICVHEINYTDDQVLASGNGENPAWYPMTEQHNENTDEWEQGFVFGSFFVPFSQVMLV